MLSFGRAWRRWLRLGLPLIVVAFLLGAMVGLLGRLPGAPGNLRELMWRGGNPLNWLMFGLWICWLGIGSGLMALSMRRWPAAVLLSPLLAVAVSVTSFAFLCLSVTPESLHDILGVPVWTQSGWQVAQTLPPAAQQAIALHPRLADYVEMGGRYIGIYAPIPILVSLAVVLLGNYVAYGRRAPGGLPLLAISIGMLWLCKLIVVDHAVTSNVVELIAQRSAFGIPAMFWLYLALFLLAVGAALTWGSMIGLLSPLLALFLSLLLFPVGFLAATQGLEGAVEKYGHRFSALQFLLAGDRAGDWSVAATIAAWAGIQIVFCLLLAPGLRLAIPGWRPAAGAAGAPGQGSVGVPAA
jgi:hypothetical protein